MIPLLLALNAPIPKLHVTLEGHPSRLPSVVSDAAARCKLYEYKDGCNICQVRRCTDGKVQWDAGLVMCTVAGCVNEKRNKKPYDPKFWEEE